MNGAAFPSPTAEMAEINRIQYEIDYTAGISQSMRIPEKLKIASSGGEARQGGSGDTHYRNAMMQVPERIVVSGDHEDGQYSRPRDLDLIQSTPLESLALKTPPRVLTLTERPLDFLDLERSVTQTPQNEEACIEEVRTQGRVKRERSMSENAIRQNGQMVRNDSIVAPSLLIQPRLYPPLTSADDGRNLYSARGVLSLIQSTTRRAYQQVMEVLDENHRSRPVLRGGSASATSSNPVHDSRSGLSALDSTLEGTSDDLTVVDATSLRRQIIKLNRRLQHLEEDNKERGKREMVMYSITVAFWLINSWMWFRR
ncbi:mitochondrial fission factor-like isoform X1 [Acipenser ruthenus]|uniref:mitochondrial fission factor-like isoform X1 n=1 Tax=Acipenser ruthenus TaxID=7906 RepID=UPI00145A2048|nr:mitochondrial fission factor-like isoform X1 [Acipenser ruthenus]XP_058890467.1 mitochondrial fission factor-like isoform X1 [Acipenser ruthenus]XP_058890468.1 mitochondrial fission factor-like isoform X1 [Acipenser ruthenus]